MRGEVWPAAVGSGPEGGATGACPGLKTGRPGVLQEEMWYDASKLGHR